MSLNRVVTLSMIALLVFQVYAVLALHVVVEKWGIGALTAALIAFLALIGGWQWGLLAAVRGSRRWLIAAALINLIPVAGAISDVLVFCPSPCQGNWYPNTISHWATLITGLIAIAAVGVYLKGGARAADQS